MVNNFKRMHIKNGKTNWLKNERMISSGNGGGFDFKNF
jgi:hypothetical protein